MFILTKIFDAIKSPLFTNILILSLIVFFWINKPVQNITNTNTNTNSNYQGQSQMTAVFNSIPSNLKWKSELINSENCPNTLFSNKFAECIYNKVKDKNVPYFVHSITTQSFILEYPVLDQK